MAMNQKRIVKEFAECSQSPPPGTSVRLVDEADVLKWEILIDGPEQSVYAGGHFKLLLTLPSDYPFKAPTLSFITKIYHPNVSNDDKGTICIGMLRSDTWKPPNRISTVLAVARNLLLEPQPDDAVETSIADQYKNNRKEFDKAAKDWVKRYASGKN